MKRWFFILAFFFGALLAPSARAAIYERIPAGSAASSSFSIHFSFTDLADLTGASGDPDYGQGAGCGAPTNFIFSYSVYGTGDILGTPDDTADQNDQFRGNSYPITNADIKEAYNSDTVVPYVVQPANIAGGNRFRGIAVNWYNLNHGGTSAEDAQCFGRRWLEGDGENEKFIFKLLLPAPKIKETLNLASSSNPTASSAAILFIDISNSTNTAAILPLETTVSSSAASLSEIQIAASRTQALSAATKASSTLFIDVSSSDVISSTPGILESALGSSSAPIIQATLSAATSSRQ